jgi:hypothetical protein
MLSSPWSSLVASRAGGRVPGWEGCARAGRKGRRAGGSDEGADLVAGDGFLLEQSGGELGEGLPVAGEQLPGAGFRFGQQGGDFLVD